MKAFKKFLSVFLSAVIMVSVMCMGTVSASAAEDEFTLSAKFIKGKEVFEGDGAAAMLQITVGGISKKDITDIYKKSNCDSVALHIGFYLDKAHIYYGFGFDNNGKLVKMKYDFATVSSWDYETFDNDIKTKGTSDVTLGGGYGTSYYDDWSNDFYGYKDKFDGNTFTTNRGYTYYAPIKDYPLSSLNKENEMLLLMNYIKEADIALTYYDKSGETVYVKQGKANFNAKSSSSSSSSSKKISSLSISKISDKAYTGKAIKPSVTVKDGETKLKKGTDYTVTYKNNKNIGTASVTIKGKGNYTGSKTIEFEIVPAKTTLKASKKSDTKVTLTWDKVAGAEKYQIYYSENGGKYKKLATVSGTKTSYTNSKLDFEKNDYKFKIRAYDKVDGKTYYGSYSKVVTVK